MTRTNARSLLAVTKKSKIPRPRILGLEVLLLQLLRASFIVRYVGIYSMACGFSVCEKLKLVTF